MPKDLEENKHLLRIKEQVDPYLEMASIQRQVYAQKGPALYFENVKGTRSEIDSFMKALRSERNYMHAYKRHGLGDKRTYNSKYKLDKAVQGFEKTTKLKWPFK